ncbi:peptide deformylase [Rarobacter incanus]|uniref:Peptide deformylase n=1 Tax=Rarobacter incanus TaxID=153494 RepID=A0A542SR54_9MICO|nr:peptide deformylase [Rarobacter incanus]TQK77091.1 peptide deformylase [Rarobacter incanus]
MKPNGADRGLRAAVEELLRRYPNGIFPIVGAGDPVLRNPVQPYAGQLGDLLDATLDAMRRTMLDAPGVGLAANQIGLPLALAVMWDPGTDTSDPRERSPFACRAVINPTYQVVPSPDTGLVESRTFYEGCLSVPGYQAEVTRHRAVRFRGTDQDGTEFDEVLVGWPARIAQHETDHLAATLYVDKADLRTLATNQWLAAARSLPS